MQTPLNTRVIRCQMQRAQESRFPKGVGILQFPSCSELLSSAPWWYVLIPSKRPLFDIKSLTAWLFPIMWTWIEFRLYRHKENNISLSLAENFLTLRGIFLAKLSGCIYLNFSNIALPLFQSARWAIYLLRILWWDYFPWARGILICEIWILHFHFLICQKNRLHHHSSSMCVCKPLRQL